MEVDLDIIKTIVNDINDENGDNDKHDVNDNDDEHDKKIKMAITWPTFKLGSPDFAW